MQQLEVESVSRIGDLLPVGKITLLTGLPGVGKTFSILKFLNQNNIKPIYFNLDETEIKDMDVYNFGSDKLTDFISCKYKDLKDEVIVIDTYARFQYHISSITDGSPSKEDITKAIEEIVKYYGCTLIILGHPEDYQGSDGIFKDNPSLARNCYEYIHLSKEVKSKTAKGVTTKEALYFMYVMKGRNYTGSRIIENWMR